MPFIHTLYSLNCLQIKVETIIELCKCGAKIMCDA